MAAVLHTNDTVQVTAVSTYCGQTCMNTFPGRIEVVSGAPPAIAGLDALLTFFANAANLFDTLRGCMPQNCIINQGWAQVIRPVRLRAVKQALDLVGQFVEIDGLTANVQAAVERFGELANKHSIGGVRVPIGTDDSCFDDGELTPALKTALTLLGVNMHTTVTITGTGWQFRFVPAVGLSKDSLATQDCVGTIVQDTVRVIRRRTVRVGI